MFRRTFARAFPMVLLLLLAVHSPARASHGSGSGSSNSGKGRGRGGANDALPGVRRPGDRIRESSTSRNQVTESPATIAKGTWTAELGLVSYSHDALDSLRTDATEFAPASAGYGLTDRVELSVSGDPYGLDRERNLQAGTDETNAGPGGYGARLKTCWAGTDSSAWALGTTLFVNQAAPGDSLTAKPEFGVKFPVRVALPADLQLGLMAELDVRDDVDGRTQHREFVESANVSRGFGDHLSAFVEVVSVSSSRPTQAWLGALDVGAYWEPLAHVSVGLTGTYGYSDRRGDAGLVAGLSVHR